MMVKCGRPCKGDEQQSRDRLLDSALGLFLEHGYGNLSMETIARDARVSLRTIYNQFGGKAGLFGAVIRRCSDQFHDSLARDLPLEAALVQFATEFLFRITRPDVVRIRAILIGESPRFPDLATQFYEQGPQRTLDHLTQFFRHHQAQGAIVAVDPDLLADQLLGVLRGERLQRLQLGLDTTPDETDIAVWVSRVIPLFLRGCQKSATPGETSQTGAFPSPPAIGPDPVR